MEVGRNGVLDAYEAARRCLAAMGDTQDIDARQGLWKAASRYARLGREKMAGARPEGTGLINAAQESGSRW